MKSLFRRIRRITSTGAKGVFSVQGNGIDLDTHSSFIGEEGSMKSISRVVRIPHLTGVLNRHMDPQDKVRLLSIVSRNSPNQDEHVPLLAEETTSASCSSDEGRSNKAVSMSSEFTFTRIDHASQRQLIDVTESAPAVSGPVKTTLEADDGKRHEWVFTLYDFDGRGTPSKEDILSIVRAIYDVLGSAKIQPHNTVEEKKSDRRTFGAFKIKLSLTADENSDVAIRNSSHNNGHECHVTEGGGGARRPNRRSSLLMDCGKMKGKAGTCSSKIHAATSVTAIDEGHQQTGNDQHEPPPTVFLRRHKKPAKRRGAVGGVERYSPPPVNGRKMYRRSVSVSQQNMDASNGNRMETTAQCSSCTYRDYVNLSEVENCCCSNGQYHHEQPKRHSGTVHHIRHCDRHCHCPMPDRSTGCHRLDGKGKEFAYHSNTAMVRRCADIVHRHSSPQSPMCCGFIDSVPTAPSNTSLRVNVQARAYYQDRLFAAQARAEDQRRFSTSFEKENGPNNPSPVVNQPTEVYNRSAASNQPSRKQKGKDVRSMKQVRSLVFNDQQYPIDNHDRSPGESRGVADGSDRLYVEHKHIHKHNHYHHHYY